MTWLDPFTAFTGNIIAAADWNNSGRDNLRHLRVILPDPSAIGDILVASSTTPPGGAWTTPNGDTILTAATVTGNAPTSAIGVESVAADRLVDGAFSEAEATRLFAVAAILGTLLKPGTVPYTALDAANSPVDGYSYGYSASAGKGSWISPTAVAGVPSGAVMMVRTAAEIGAGYARETNLDGRIPVGAGTTFSTTFVENTAYGSSWAHGHTEASHNHDLTPHSHAFGGGATATGVAQGGVAYDEDETGGGHDTRDGNHSHLFNGNTAGNGTINTGAQINSTGVGSTAWAIPSRAYVFMRKT